MLLWLGCDSIWDLRSLTTEALAGWPWRQRIIAGPSILGLECEEFWYWTSKERQIESVWESNPSNVKLQKASQQPEPWFQISTQEVLILERPCHVIRKSHTACRHIDAAQHWCNRMQVQVRSCWYQQHVHACGPTNESWWIQALTNQNFVLNDPNDRIWPRAWPHGCHLQTFWLSPSCP